MSKPYGIEDARFDADQRGLCPDCFREETQCICTDLCFYCQRPVLYRHMEQVERRSEPSPVLACPECADRHRM